MSAIAKRFVFGMAAAAQANRGSPTQPERLSFRVHYFKVTLNPDRTVVEDNHFCRHQT